jgi:hypothetical protein
MTIVDDRQVSSKPGSPVWEERDFEGSARVTGKRVGIIYGF